MTYPGLKPFKCRAGILAQPGPQLKLSRYGFDELNIRYLLGIGWQTYLYAPGDQLEDNIGDQLKYNGISKLYCNSVNISSHRGSLYADVSFKGILTKKYPEGGGGVFLNEAGIDTHPNYQWRPDTWAEKKFELFGTGPSPNNYGRITDADGAFVRFGKSDIAPCGLAPEDPVTWACDMVGVESYLTVGQLSYEYSILTAKDWLEDEMEYLGRAGTLKSRYIPPPDVSGNWLFNGFTREVTYVGQEPFYKTTVTFLGSGSGGWHPWIYRPKTSGWDLDKLAGVK